MSNKQILGICGRKGAGKSTLANFMPFARILPIAGGIKRGLAGMGIPPEILVEPSLKEVPHELLLGKTPRHAMVTLGTEWGRDQIGEGFWLGLWKKHALEASHTYIIVDDVRFPNEVKLLREMGAFLVAIERERRVKPRKWWQFWGEKRHLSESLRYEDFDIPVLLNDGTPEELFEKFRAIVPTSWA